LPRKRAWPVPRGRRRGNAPPLPDWKGPLYRLEAQGFECVLADAKQVRHLPGRPKNDRCDARWLAACFERGTVTPCFVACPQFRVIRLHTRYRRDLTEDRTRDKQRAEKLLESAALKLSSVLIDLALAENLIHAGESHVVGDLGCRGFVGPVEQGNAYGEVVAAA